MKIKYYLVMILCVFTSFVFSSQKIEAKEVLKSGNATEWNETIGTVEIYDDASVVVKYRYGLKKLIVSYCKRDDTCLSNEYEQTIVVDSTKSNPHKNSDTTQMKTYSYSLSLPSQSEYRIRAQAYVAKNNTYTGEEDENRASIRCITITTSNYVESSHQNDDVVGEDNDVMKVIRNTVVPALLIVLGILYAVRGTVLGVKIVKGADEAPERAEAIQSLKSMTIGLAVAYVVIGLVEVLLFVFKEQTNQ